MEHTKKILFVIPDYWLAGTNKSLENLLSILDEKKYDVNVFALNNDGDDYIKQQFEPYLVKPSIRYSICTQNYYTRKIFNLFTLKNERIKYAEQRRGLYYLFKNNNYDYIIAYSEGIVTQLVAGLDVQAKKIAWIHWFYGSGVVEKKDTEKDSLVYSSFYRIICVSNMASEAFIKHIPCLSNKVEYIYNVLDTKTIIERGNIPIDDNSFKKKSFTIVSVGRMAWGKQIHLIPGILSKALEHSEQKNVVWYIIGERINSQDEFDKNLKKYHMENHVIHLGVKDNPYPYIRMADLLVCPSISESFSYVINEALVLHTPVLANDFPVAYEMLNDNTGYVCPISQMGEKLSELINDEDGKYSIVRDGVKSFVYDNCAIKKQIDDLLSK